MQRGLNPPPKHGPIFLIMKAGSKKNGNINKVVLPNNVGPSGQEVVGH